MENKYYTPEISDIKIGYECEIWFSHAYAKENWEPYVFKYYDEKEDVFYNHDVLIHNIIDNADKIRTPYLTKEQIETEGWKLLGVVKEDTIIAYLKKETIIYTINYKKSILTITKLLRKENMNFLDDQLYKGTCPSINEFRTICKLLNIK